MPSSEIKADMESFLQKTSHSAFEKSSQNTAPQSNNNNLDYQGDWNQYQPHSKFSFFKKIPTYVQRVGLYIWYRGPLATFISATLGAYAEFLCKRLISERVPSLQLSLFISIFALAFSLAQAFITKIPRREILGQRATVPYLLARGMFGAISNTLFFLSLALLNLTEAELVFFLNPIFIVPLAVVYLDEPVGTFTVLSYLVAIGGFVLVEKPSFIFSDESWSPGRIQGLAEGILGALAAASSYISIAMVGDYEYSVTFNTYFYGFCVVCCLIVGPIVQTFVVPSIKELLSILFISIFHFAGQLLLTRGFQISKAVTVATINYTNVVYSYVYDTIFFGNSPDFYGVLGSDLIAASLFMVNADKKLELHRQEVEAEDRTRLLQEEEEELYGINKPLTEAEQEEVDEQEQEDHLTNLNQGGQIKQGLQSSGSQQAYILPSDLKNVQGQQGVNLQYHKDLKLDPEEPGNEAYIKRILSGQLDKDQPQQQQQDPKDKQ